MICSYEYITLKKKKIILIRKKNILLRIKFNLVGPFFFTKTERSKHTSSKRKNRIKTRIIDLTPPKFNKHL